MTTTQLLTWPGATTLLSNPPPSLTLESTGDGSLRLDHAMLLISGHVYEEAVTLYYGCYGHDSFYS